MHGNSSTTPSGMEMLEFPLNRSGRLKNANLEDTVLPFVLLSSTIGSLADEGKRFMTFCTRPIVALLLVSQEP